MKTFVSDGIRTQTNMNKREYLRTKKKKNKRNQQNKLHKKETKDPVQIAFDEAIKSDDPLGVFHKELGIR
jgi:hypothetical protein